MQPGRITFRVFPRVELLHDGSYLAEAVVVAYQGIAPINETTIYASRVTALRCDAIALANELTADIQETFNDRPALPDIGLPAIHAMLQRIADDP